MNDEQGIETSGLWNQRIRSEGMMFQTQSKSYENWMKEDAWDFALETLPASAFLPLAEFKTYRDLPWHLPRPDPRNARLRDSIHP
jgi:hypothetical protein